jgi:two-component system, OmpR family, sensor histidine kinase ChvG
MSAAAPGRLRRFFAHLLHGVARIRYRLLAVNLFVVLVPAAGSEFARIYEKQLLDALERDMANQAAVVKAFVAADLAAGWSLGSTGEEHVLARAALQTRTRIRIVDRSGVLVDSHRGGPPEGREPAPPRLAPTVRGDSTKGANDEPPIERRPELVEAFAGRRGTATRVARSGVFLFLAEPLRHDGNVVGAIYVTRSTSPVLFELHRIRSGLIVVMSVAVGFSVLLTLILALTISRPLERLSRAARGIAAGDQGVVIPVGGGGELGELSRSFAEMTQKLEARQRYISEFAADVAHEFKSPLTSIRGAAELLAEGADDDPEARRRFLRNIELDAGRLDRLVSRLLELSRIDASDEHPQIVDLRTLCERAIERSQTPDGAVVLRYESSVHFVRARESDLETALLNLLDNALRFSPPGVPVEMAVSGERRARFVEIAVTDRGPGIPPEHLPRIFERFYTTDAERDGTGLGLAIVKSVALSHGGTVEVETPSEGGARFVVRLPASRERSGGARTI